MDMVGKKLLIIMCMFFVIGSVGIVAGAEWDSLGIGWDLTGTCASPSTKKLMLQLVIWRLAS